MALAPVVRALERLAAEVDALERLGVRAQEVDEVGRVVGNRGEEVEAEEGEGHVGREEAREEGRVEAGPDAQRREVRQLEARAALDRPQVRRVDVAEVEVDRDERRRELGEEGGERVERDVGLGADELDALERRRDGYGALEEGRRDEFGALDVQALEVREARQALRELDRVGPERRRPALDGQRLEVRLPLEEGKVAHAVRHRCDDGEAQVLELKDGVRLLSWLGQVDLLDVVAHADQARRHLVASARVRILDRPAAAGLDRNAAEVDEADVRGVGREHLLEALEGGLVEPAHGEGLQGVGESVSAR